MQQITEATIDQVAESLNQSESAYEAAVEGLRSEQPVLLALLFSENFEVFTRREREFLLYALLVIWQSVKAVDAGRPALTGQQLSQAEEGNWERLQGVQAHRFRERLDLFFENYPQEDLLAFVEDAILAGLEDGLITDEGKEPMFVSLKSVIDCLTG